MQRTLTMPTRYATMVLSEMMHTSRRLDLGGYSAVALHDSTVALAIDSEVHVWDKEYWQVRVPMVPFLLQDGSRYANTITAMEFTTISGYDDPFLVIGLSNGGWLLIQKMELIYMHVGGRYGMFPMADPIVEIITKKANVFHTEYFLTIRQASTIVHIREEDLMEAISSATRHHLGDIVNIDLVEEDSSLVRICTSTGQDLSYQPRLSYLSFSLKDFDHRFGFFALPRVNTSGAELFIHPGHQVPHLILSKASYCFVSPRPVVSHIVPITADVNTPLLPQAFFDELKQVVDPATSQIETASFKVDLEVTNTVFYAARYVGSSIVDVADYAAGHLVGDIEPLLESQAWDFNRLQIGALRPDPRSDLGLILKNRQLPEVLPTEDAWKSHPILGKAYRIYNSPFYVPTAGWVSPDGQEYLIVITIDLVILLFHLYTLEVHATIPLSKPIDLIDPPRLTAGCTATSLHVCLSMGPEQSSYYWILSMPTLQILVSKECHPCCLLQQGTTLLVLEALETQPEAVRIQLTHEQ
ncbi:hypothetical protein GMRT_10185 [Giardia muris]|uniref:Uncharacterized protein n=1 Tax=Giardia muris TaxID=5742 RepID=A0A4Z1T1D5_GIAMU|nr:hypothetical protein GMRT_10185 [Giardia muris]|eukprot:TNJ26747.1 hypothetical protein GMRT_10185 [Giardia muris]